MKLQNKMSPGIEELIDRMTEITLNKHPALEGIVRPFSSVFKAKACLVEELKLESPRISLPAGPMPSENPVLLGIDLEPLRHPVEKAAKSILDAVSKAFPALSHHISQIMDAVELGRIDYIPLAEKYLESGSQGLESAGKSAGVSPDCLDLVVRLSLSAVLEALISFSATEAEQNFWTKGYCPVCGFLPSISYLDRVPETQSEFLKSGGGQKYLHCSLCGHDWRTRRHMCPLCETDEPGDRMYFQTDSDTGERVDVCRKCNVYLPCIDLRRTGPIQHLDISAVGMVHLDVMAQKKGFKPMTWAPWNRIE